MRERDLKALEFDKVIHLVMEFCASEPGREATAALRPSIDAVEVRRRLDSTAEMAGLRSHAGSIPISEFTDQRPYLLAAARAGAILGGEALVKVRDFIVGARHVGGFIRSRVERFPHVAALVHNLLAPKELADAMLGALADDGGILDDASRELKRLRSRLRDERAELEARLLRSLNAPGMESFVSDYIVTIRNRRFVLPMKLNYAERFEGIVQDRSVSGETLFVEPMWAVELNNRLMMLEREAEAEETRILARLTAMVGGYAPELQLTFDAMVALDALNARAIFAERFRCVEPELVDEGIDFIGARHPLLMTSGREVIPIDVKIGAGQRGIVISGPNTGGKTVALKTVGLLSLMAQAGMLIPALAGSKATVFRSVFADIGDEQSIESNLSSFSGHIANLSEIIRSLVEPALVILDEPGAGTDPAEGAALAIGLMNHLGTRRCMLAIATHSTAVKLHAYSQAGFEAAAVDFDAERLEPLYRLKPHTIGQSYGLAVARRLGLPEEIIRAAEQSMGAGTLELTDALKRLDGERAKLNAQAEKLREREAGLARIEQEVLQSAEKTRERGELERKRLRAEVADLIEEIRRDGAALMDELKTRTKSRTDLKGFITKAAAKLESLAPAAEDKTGPRSDAPLKVGDSVEIGDIRGELIVLESGRAVISRGGLRIEVAPERLRRAAASAPENRPARTKAATVTFNVEGGERNELNLIGMRTTDALRKLEEFLDTAFLTNRAEVRIIHGIGSGALRKAVTEYLGTSPYCASFRGAEPHHGGAGATIVQMNL
ncbi:endonuclease MutS2 [Candidatus Binatus soli]|jgi:DNA mismatch repair protein MutS2|uniref:endonuclease MutS2 n=1 Tax=Candidatus Binatus soli TaxID=1953413 RepID=UPI003D0A9BF1